MIVHMFLSLLCFYSTGVNSAQKHKYEKDDAVTNFSIITQTQYSNMQCEFCEASFQTEHKRQPTSSVKSTKKINQIDKKHTSTSKVQAKNEITAIVLQKAAQFYTWHIMHKQNQTDGCPPGIWVCFKVSSFHHFPHHSTKCFLIGEC